MLYTDETEVPKNTPKDDPLEVQIEVEEFYVTRGEVYFPNGCAGIVGASYWYGAEMIMPNPKYGWMKGNDETPGGRIGQPLAEGGETITLKLYNESGNFSHSPIWRLWAEPKISGAWRQALGQMAKFLRKITRVLGGGL